MITTTDREWRVDFAGRCLNHLLTATVLDEIDARISKARDEEAVKRVNLENENALLRATGEDLRGQLLALHTEQQLRK